MVIDQGVLSFLGLFCCNLLFSFWGVYVVFMFCGIYVALAALTIVVARK
jgi:hypothetical protein